MKYYSPTLPLTVKKQKFTPETETKFFTALKKFTEPFAFWSNASFAYWAASGAAARFVGEQCVCGNFNGAGKGNFGAKKHYLQEVEHDGQDLGRLVLCCARTTPHAGRTLESLAEMALGELSRLEDEDALYAELSASWESLQAVYDLNADFNSFQDPAVLLGKITERTKAIHDEIRAVLWLENGENLEPAAANGDFDVEPRSKSEGIIGEVFTKKRSAIFNGAESIGRFDEPEFKNACCAALIPLKTHLAACGVLVVWLESADFAFDSRKMRLLDTLALQAAMVAENNRLRLESIQNAKLNHEIEIGSKIQQTLLSGTPPASPAGIEIAAASISSQKIDGDFYDFIEHGADCFDLIVGDVMGKGIPAALVGAATKNSFLRAIGYLQATENALRPSAEKIVGFVNREMTPKLIRFESFVTACYTRFELTRSEITFVDCGHTKTIHYQASERRVRLLEGENLPLGFAEREIFVEKTVKVQTGDVLFFYSDGVTETRNPAGELFGDRRLEEFIRRNARLAPQRMIDTLIETLNNFSGTFTFHDDLTCIAVRFGQKSDQTTRGEY